MAKKKSFKMTVLAMACIVGLVLAFAAYQGRAWLRTTAIPSAVSSVYKPRVNSVFNATFYPVNQKLAAYGFKLEWDQPASCGKGSFEGFNETVTCSRMIALELPKYSDTTVKQWQAEAPGLARYLEEHRWDRRSRTQELSDLYTGHSTDQPLNVTYAQRRNGIQCELQLIYYGWEDNKDKAKGYESCELDFNIFLGSGPGGTY